MNPCSHCHTVPEVEQYVIRPDDAPAEVLRQHVTCPGCGMRGPGAETEEEAVGLWNKITGGGKKTATV